VNETARFVLDVLAEDGFGPGGAAVRAIQKVRLVHAAVRQKLAGLAAFEGETPINQEDMLGTLFTFSVIVVRAVRRLSVPVDDRQADDFWALWRGAGAMLGVRDDLLPRDFASACDLADRIAARQVATSEHGRALTASLLEGMERHVPGLRFAPRALVRYLVGDRISDVLGVPADGAFQTKLAALRLLPRGPSGPLAALARSIAPLLGRPLLEGIVAAKLGGRRPSFPMPLTVVA
jgi:hypothetical protein